MKTDLWRLGAADLARVIREKTVSIREVVQSHLDRIEAVNDKLNAVTVVLHEEALRAAREADKALAAGTLLGPLHGVPVTIKENIDLAGSATSQGLLSLQEARPQQNAPHIVLPTKVSFLHC